jgi:plasmid stabilization system protein ParE
MALPYRLSSIAENDISRIIEHIAQNNLDAALNLIDRFTQAFILLSTNPELGEKCPHLDLSLRQFVVEKYLVTYQITPEEIIIIRVTHGAQILREYY